MYNITMELSFTNIKNFKIKFSQIYISHGIWNAKLLTF